MSSSQSRAPRPSAIRRRPQQPNTQQSQSSVDEFINSGTSNDISAATEVVTTPNPTIAPEPSLETVHPVPTPPVIHEIPHHISPPVMTTATTPPESNTNNAAHSYTPSYQTHYVSKESGGMTYFALFLGVCALGVGLFNLYHFWGPMVKGMQQIVHSEPPPQLKTETIIPPLVPMVNGENQIDMQSNNGIKSVQWFAITDLQFARHDFLLGLNSSAQESLILAKIHLSLLGDAFIAEAAALDRIIANIENSSILSLGQLDRDLENFKETWLRVTSNVYTQSNKGLFSWFSSPKPISRQNLLEEIANTEEGRNLSTRLDRLKWLALWGDEQGFHQASISLENFLGKNFLESSESKTWLTWLRSLQKIPLRHDVTELNSLIVRLSRLELNP